jgi:DNA invertase Pin-like site-specific DNA recombinase
MLGVFAEFERALIRERVLSGIARAKAAGKHCGRPRVRDGVEGHAVKLAASGLSSRAIAARLNVSAATVQRALAAARAA